MRARFIAAAAAILFIAGGEVRAQYFQTDFPAEEFRRRHAKVFEAIGAAAVAVVQGMPQTEGFTLPRQHNTFYYLSGIETPGAYLLLDGRTRKVTIYRPGATRGSRPPRGACLPQKTSTSSGASRAPTK
jgi:Aminopeptidase P, N-terminal domain